MKSLLFAVGVLALVGCKGFHPVGPLAKKVPITQQGKDIPRPQADAAASRAPAPKLTPPTMLVNPGDITVANAPEMAQRLATEQSADAKSAVNAPVTAEVSYIKGGVKQK